MKKTRFRFISYHNRRSILLLLYSMIGCVGKAWLRASMAQKKSGENNKKIRTEHVRMVRRYSSFFSGVPSLSRLLPEITFNGFRHKNWPQVPYNLGVLIGRTYVRSNSTVQAQSRGNYCQQVRICWQNNTASAATDVSVVRLPITLLSLIHI